MDVSCWKRQDQSQNERVEEQVGVKREERRNEGEGLRGRYAIEMMCGAISTKVPKKGSQVNRALSQHLSGGRWRRCSQRRGCLAGSGGFASGGVSMSAIRGGERSIGATICESARERA